METRKKLKISWNTVLAEVKNISPTPNNYKIKTALGKERLQASLKSFGLASAVVCDYAGKFGDLTKLILIDGNSRREEAIKAGEKKIWVSLPSRKLTPSEYVEMSAMFDFAKAGEVDLERIEKDLGTTSNFYEKYAIEPPMELLNNLGAKAPKGPKESENVPLPPVEKDEVAVSLFYNKKEYALFLQIEEKLKKRYKTNSTSATILKALKSI